MVNCMAFINFFWYIGDLLNFFHTLHIGRLLKHFLCITDREAFVAFFDALKIGKLSKHFKVKHTQKIRRLLPTNCLSVFEKPANCLSVFEHFDGLVLKGIIFLHHCKLLWNIWPQIVSVMAPGRKIQSEITYQDLN